MVAPAWASIRVPARRTRAQRHREPALGPARSSVRRPTPRRSSSTSAGREQAEDETRTMALDSNLPRGGAGGAHARAAAHDRDRDRPDADRRRGSWPRVRRVARRQRAERPEAAHHPRRADRRRRARRMRNPSSRASSQSVSRPKPPSFAPEPETAGAEFADQLVSLVRDRQSPGPRVACAAGVAIGPSTRSGHGCRVHPGLSRIAADRNHRGD